MLSYVRPHAPYDPPACYYDMYKNKALAPPFSGDWDDLERLRREGRGGTVEPIAPGRWRYTTQVSDTGEMMNWVKTFIGRIVALEGDGQEAIQRFHDDIRRLAEMYGGEG